MRFSQYRYLRRPRMYPLPHSWSTIFILAVPKTPLLSLSSQRVRLLENLRYSPHYSLFLISRRCPSASLDYIVEPWFLGAGSDSPAGQEFKEFKDETESKYGTAFATSLDDLPEPKAPRLALISGRTADNPRLLTESIAHGAKVSVKKECQSNFAKNNPYYWTHQFHSIPKSKIIVHLP